MDVGQLLDSHTYLYVTSVAEPEDNVLLVRVEEGRVLQGEAGADGLIGAPIVADEQSTAYELLFPAYVAYAVRNESYTVCDPEEEFTGRVFAIYTRSKFLDFVRAGTFADDAYPGPYTHYAIHALNHILDVAALEPPELTVVRAGHSPRPPA